MKKQAISGGGLLPASLPPCRTMKNPKPEALMNHAERSIARLKDVFTRPGGTACRPRVPRAGTGPAGYRDRHLASSSGRFFVMQKIAAVHI